MPTLRAVGTIDGGAGSIAPGLPAGTVAGDLLIMFLECRGEESAGASGWTQVLAPASTGTTTGGTKLTALYRVATGTDPTTTNDSGNHQMGRVIGITTGTYDPADPFDATGSGVDAASSTAVTIPAITTTIAGTLVVVATSGNLPDAASTTEFSGWTNANLTGLTEQIDNTATTGGGDGGAIGVATGTKETAGDTGTTTVTAVTMATRAKLVFAINPVPPAVYDATGSLGIKNLVGFAPTVVLERTYPSTSLLGVANLEGFAGTARTEFTYSLTGSLGTVRLEGFPFQGTLYYDALGYIRAQGQTATVEVVSFVANPLLGTVNFEGIAGSVGVTYTVTSLTGEVYFSGFAGSIPLAGQIDVTSQLGETYTVGFAPVVSVTEATSEVVVQDQGAGSGRSTDIMIQMADEDKLVFDIIKQFLRAA